MKRLQRSFTLIELLAVIAIATLVMAISAISIGATSDHTAFARMMAMLQQMDARARMHARTGGRAMMLKVDPAMRRIRLLGSSHHEVLAQADVPTTIRLTLEIRHAKPQIVFDRRGISEDYAIVLRSDTRSARLEVAGLSGEIRSREIPP